jgi:hypothetical protein
LLLEHLEDPATSDDTAEELGAALAALADPDARARLTSLLLLHHADPAAAPFAASVLDALLAVGGPAERQVVAYVAADPRSAPALAAHARARLEGPPGASEGAGNGRPAGEAQPSEVEPRRRSERSGRK